MAAVPRIVVAGFGRWPEAERNPASQIAEALKPERWHQCQVIPLVMPVSSATLESKVREVLLQHQPDVWIGLGVNSRLGMIRPEMLGINWRRFRVPDADGAMLDTCTIFDDAPAAYHSALPNERIVHALKAHGIPAQLSFHAGTHLCNQMLYTVCHLASELQMQVRSGFIHVPQTPENIAMSSSEQWHECSMSLAMMVESIECAIDVICENLPSASEGHTQEADA